MHGDIFYPTAFLRMILPTDVAMTWGFNPHLLAGFFNLPVPSCMGSRLSRERHGGVAYLMCGPIAAYALPVMTEALRQCDQLPLALFPHPRHS
jgi:hypothetical protein